MVNSTPALRAPVKPPPATANGSGVAARILSTPQMPGAPGTPSAPQTVTQVIAALPFFRCRFCQCRGRHRTVCPFCGRRNCLELDAPTALSAEVPEQKKRGNLAAAMAAGTAILRRKTGIPKFDKVLGGGFVDKSAILIAGDPGAGKSTLLMQTCVTFAGHRKFKGESNSEPLRALYCTGEEAPEQVGARAARIPGAFDKGEWIELVSTTSVPEIMGTILDYKPHLTIVDSIQEVGDEAIQGRFGGETQVSNAIRSVMRCIREVGFGTAIFVCHVRKDGDIAGAKKAEHLVDVTCKLSLDPREDDEDEDDDDESRRGKKKKKRADEIVVHDERVLEAYKNRYGSIMDVSVFTMTDKGLR